MKDEELVKEAHERFQKSQDYYASNRNNFLDDVKFYTGETQWPEAMRKERENDGRPALVVNRIPQFVRQVTNDQRQNRPSIKIQPVDDHADPDTAEVMQGLIRHIEQNSGADIAYDNGFFYSVVGGFGYWRITTDYVGDSFEQEIYINPIPNSLNVYGDADSTALDGSDWRHGFVFEDISKEQFKREYPDVEPESWPTAQTTWSTDDKVRVAEYFYIEHEDKKKYLLEDGRIVDSVPDGQTAEKERTIKQPKVMWAKIGGHSVLEKGEWAGKYIPIVPVYGDIVDINGRREYVSLTRYAKDAQRMLNYYRSAETELIALQPKAPFIVTQKQIEGYEDEWGMANKSNLPYLTVNSTTDGMPQRQGFAAPPSGVLTGAANAAQDMMDITGIQRAGLGMQSNETSGRAIMARQAEGDNSTYHFIDNMKRAIRQTGRILVDLIPHIYDTPRVLRIIGADDTDKMYQVNQPIQEKDEWGKAVERIYDLTTGTYDVVVSSGPSYATKAQQAREGMFQVLQGNPQLMQIAGDLFIKAMDWPGAHEIAERLKKMLPPNLAETDGEQDMPPEIKAMIESMMAEKEQMMQALDDMQAQLQSKEVENLLKAREVKIKEYEAETKRMQVMERPAQDVSGGIDEADKLQADIDLKLKLKEMELDHAEEMRMFDAKLELLKIRKGADADLTQIGDDLEEEPSEMAQALIDQIVALNNQIAELSKPKGPIQIERDEAGIIIGAGGRRVIRDKSGRAIGLE